MLRALSPKGLKQAARMAAWLERKVPEQTRVVCSPALRADQTAMALGRKYKVRDEVGPHGDVDSLLELVKWQTANGSWLIVGHQPNLGSTIARLLDMGDAACNVKKGAVWWLRTRLNEGVLQTQIVAVLSPEMA